MADITCWSRRHWGFRSSPGRMSSTSTKFASLLVAAGAVVKVADSDELLHTVSRWLEDANERHRVGQLGRQAVARNRGALQAVMAIIGRYL